MPVLAGKRGGPDSRTGRGDGAPTQLSFDALAAVLAT